MKSVSVALFALLAATPALAQQQQSPPPASPPPAAAAKPSGDLTYYSHQPQQMRASKLLGNSVRNTAGETVGDINEIILDKDGKVVAAVIGVGGFLGIGEREVALDFKSLKFSHDASAMTESGATVITVNATKDGLKAAPAWTWSRDTGTGTGQPRTTAPQPGGTTR